MLTKFIKIADYTYDLPEVRIAKFPLNSRDESKLLIYKNDISEDQFVNLQHHIPENSLIIRNNTRVVQARLNFTKNTGASIEIFCLEPKGTDPITSMQETSSTTWYCLVGNAKRWKEGDLVLQLDSGIELRAKLLSKLEGEFVVEFTWDREVQFAKVLEEAGKTPLPPYLKREAVESDKTRYQTIYAKENGSVAAPTAGLHFTSEVEKTLKQKDCDFTEVTLHVGAGTFKPVKSDKIGDHEMHYEHFEVNKAFLKSLISALKKNKSIVVVGTTSLRAVESLYWLGSQKPKHLLDQWEVYDAPNHVDAVKSLQNILDYLDQKGDSSFIARTGIMIAPGYEFKIANALITNFHQPGSTLLLLVGALIGKDWKSVYDYALSHQFRFLSYGDSSILWRK